MIDDQRLPTDDAIERGLARRAPHGPEAALLAGVMADVVATPQVNRWGPAGGGSGALGRRRGVLLAVAAAVGLIALAALAGGLGSHPSLPAVVDDTSPSPVATVRPAPTPTPNPLAIAAATASPTTPEACSPDGLVATADSSGSVTSTADGYSGLGKGRMAYLTRTGSPNGDEVDVWLASNGANVATRIATFKGHLLDVGRVGDFTPGVPDVLVSIGRSEVSAAPYCSDLYLLAPDGSSVRRLTEDPIGVEIGASRLSPDGSHVAFEANLSDPNAPTRSIVVKSVSNAKDQRVLTGPCADPVWSPDSQRVAAACTPTDATSPDTVETWDRATDTWSAIELPVGTQADTVAWMPDSGELIAITRAWSLVDGARQVDRQALTVQSVDIRTGAWLVRAQTTGSFATYGQNSSLLTVQSASIAPDHAHAVVDIYINKGGVTALLDMKTGELSALDGFSPIRYTGTWSLDSTKLVTEGGPPKLVGTGLQVRPLGGEPTFMVKLPSQFPDGSIPYAIEVP